MYKLPTVVYVIAEQFAKEGYSFWLVGGFVRDLLRGEYPHDIDVTTNARPDEIKRILKQFTDSIYTIGEKYGTIGTKMGGVDMEITTYRSDVYSEGSRKPEVDFSDFLDDDLSRRDFTINAIAMSADGEIHDPFMGQKDLREKTIRAVGDINQRLKDDPLRILRAVRFSSKFKFFVDIALVNGMRRNAHLLNTLSSERVADELSKILLLDKPSISFSLMRDTRTLDIILPEIADLLVVNQEGPYHNKNVFYHTMAVLNAAPAALDLRLAALFHDAGKAFTKTVDEDGVSHFYGHEDYSASIAYDVLKRLRFPTDTIRTVCKLVRNHMRVHSLSRYQHGSKAVRRLIRDMGGDIARLLELGEADVKGHANPDLEPIKRLRYEINMELLNTPTLEEPLSPVNGNQLMAYFGKMPGPWIGKVQQELTQAVVDGTLDPENIDEAMKIAERVVIHGGTT